MIVSSELSLNGPNAPNNILLLLSYTLLDWLGIIPIVFNALVLNIIVPRSGNTSPYEPDAGVYPPFVLPEYEVPFDPDINWYTLVDPKYCVVNVSLELSVNMRGCPADPVRCSVSEPGNNASLYRARSTDIAQKFELVTALLPIPNTNPEFSSSNINDLY